MAEKVILTLATDAPRISLRAGGDLAVHGWEESRIQVEADGEQPVLEQNEETIVLDCRADCVVSLPFDSRLAIEVVNGDASIADVHGAMNVEKVQGDLAVRNGGTLALGRIQGDLHVSNANGSLVARRVGGDAVLEKVASSVSLGGVGGDLRLQDCGDDIDASAGGDVHVDGLAGQRVRLNAGGDIRCQFVEGAGGTVQATCGGAVRIEDAATEVVRAAGVHHFSFGTGTAALRLMAGGDIILLGVGLDSDTVGEMGEEFASEMDDFAQRISQQVGQQMQSVAEQLNQFIANAEMDEEIAERIQAKLEQTSQKLETKLAAKLRRAEARVRAKAAREKTRQRRKSARRGGASIPPVPPVSPFAQATQPSAAAGEPVSEEERMMVLRMVEEKKITADEAEKLLAAMEGENLAE